MSFYIFNHHTTNDLVVSAYLLDEHKIRIVIFSPPKKYIAISIRWQYRYITDNAYTLDSASLLATTGGYDVWDCVIRVKKRDANFIVGCKDLANNTKWVSEVGEHKTIDDALPFCFIMPMISDGSLNRFLPQHPQWLNGTTLYEIFVDRYRKHSERKDCLPWEIRPPKDDFFHLAKFGGTLQGIIHSIIFDGSYLKYLGIGCIYMTPIFQSPSNHKYDTTDYYAIDRSFGNEADLLNLVQVAHENGIKVILDGHS